MKNFFWLFILLSSFINLDAQNLHIEYLNKNTKYTSIKEDLYIDGKKAVSVRDSILIHNNDKDENETSHFGFVIKEKPYKVIYFKNLANNNVIILDKIEGEIYYINDTLSKIEWDTNYNETKKIAGYLCNKATTYFRGSQITAFYTKSIPVSSGPFKFGGLPGLILEIGEIDNTSNYWVAQNIDYPYTKKILYEMPQDKNLISLKDFLIKVGEKNDKDFQKVISKLPKDVVIKRNKIERTGIEKKYEWE